MNNRELADAIADSSGRIRMISESEPQYKYFVVHLAALLKEQLKRALDKPSGDTLLDMVEQQIDKFKGPHVTSFRGLDKFVCRGCRIGFTAPQEYPEEMIKCPECSSKDFVGVE